jgi:hypothetical protein
MVILMDGLDRAESACLWLDIPFERQGNVLIVDKGGIYLRIGFYDEHFLVNIGIRTQNHLQENNINWVGFDPMRERALVDFLQNTLPTHADAEHSAQLNDKST